MVEVPNQFYSVKDKVRRVLMSLLGRRKYLLFRKPPPFDFHLYYFSPRTLENMLRQEQFETVALRTYLPHHPVYLCNPRGRWMQEALYAVGGLVGRGPSIEVIARKSGDLV